MMNILKSASKIVFLLLAASACFAFLYQVVNGTTLLETKDFMILAGMAFTFYFANKGNSSEPYAGK